MVKQPTVISTFAGCGGSSLGYKLAGFHELLAVEWDDNAVETFKLNFPGVPVYHGDIGKLTGAECMKLAGVRVGELDVFDGSPPCQGFSTAGKRRFDDPRNSLFKEFARLLVELQPKVFVMENVTGMVKGYMKQAYLTIIATLRDCGYRCKGEVLNAMYFNVPQSRERVIIIGVRNDLDIEPTHPKPQTRPMPAAAAISSVEQDETLVEARRLQKYEVGKWVVKCKPGEQASKYHPRGSFFNAARIPLDRPSQTIPKTGGFSEASLCHHSELRYLTRPELKRLGSFPDSFQMIGNLQNAYNRIGNSVPPNLMRAIAEHIRREILDKVQP
jgi:DNA (cytosine-5)-methyltransferase 1